MQALYDTTYLASLPGFVVMAAADEAELKPYDRHTGGLR